MKYALQILLGSFSTQERNAGKDEVIGRLEEVFKLLPVEHVFFGWYTDKDINREIIDFIHNHGKKAWLWIPVFSESPASVDSDRQIGYLSAGLDAGEKIRMRDYNFCCPSSEKNRDIVYNLYMEHFSDVGFDGIFLDKIRQPGFSDGLERALGCFCPRCKEHYKKYDVDVELLVEKVVNKPNILLPVSYSGCKYSFADNDVNNYYIAKAACISEGIISITNRFKDIGLKVGLDTFAPVISWFVGQDILKLAKHVDFIKPMIYRTVNLPAGIPYEVAAIVQCIPNVEAKARLCNLLGVDEISSDDSAKRQYMDMADIGCDIYPGFEIFNVNDRDPTDTSYATTQAALYSELGAKQTVLSYTLMGDTMRNIKALSTLPFNNWS